MVRPLVGSFALGVRLVIGQFLRPRAGLETLGQVRHSSSKGPEQGVRGARVPLEGAALGEDVDVGQALDDAQDLVAGSGGVHQLLRAAQRRQGVLHDRLLAGAQHHGETLAV